MGDSPSRSIKTGGGDYREIHNEGTYVEGDYFNSPAEKQDLAAAAAEIQQLLQQLEQTYSPDTTTGQMQIATAAIQQIESDPDWRQRVISALRAGGVAALESLDHPAAHLVRAALSDWQKTKPELEP